MAAASILNFHKVLFLTPDDTYIADICQHIKLGANWSRLGRDMPFCVFSKMAAAAILNFQKLLFWTPNDPCIARIYKHTRFGANCPRIGWYIPFCVVSKIAGSAILDLLFLHFGPSTMSQLLASMLRANGVIISLNLSEMLRFYYCAILDGKCLYQPILEGFEDFDP